MGRNMIYIVTAMYAEAYAFIEYFRLKKDSSHTRFQMFCNKESGIYLIISGTGTVPAAVAIGSICTEFGAGQEDFLINVGICAGISNKTGYDENVYRTGEIFWCSKIREKVSGRTFYPDILYHHGFREAQIVTGVKPYSEADGQEPAQEDFYLYDMEAAAVYQAGAYYFGTHQMSFLKVVSDDGNAGNVTRGQIEHLIGGNIERIADYIERLQTIAGRQQKNDVFMEAETERLFERLCCDMHCSRVMSEALRQHIRYFILSGENFEPVVAEMYQKGMLPCKDKREGKKCFEELRERLL